MPFARPSKGRVILLSVLALPFVAYFEHWIVFGLVVGNMADQLARETTAQIKESRLSLHVPAYEYGYALDKKYCEKYLGECFNKTVFQHAEKVFAYKDSEHEQLYVQVRQEKYDSSFEPIEGTDLYFREVNRDETIRVFLDNCNESEKPHPDVWSFPYVARISVFDYYCFGHLVGRRYREYGLMTILTGWIVGYSDPYGSDILKANFVSGVVTRSRYWN